MPQLLPVNQGTMPTAGQLEHLETDREIKRAFEVGPRVRHNQIVQAHIAAHFQPYQ